MGMSCDGGRGTGDGGWHDREISPVTRLPSPVQSEIASTRLFSLDSLEQGFEVPFPKTLRAFPLNDLVKQRRTVLHRLREDLQQVAFIIAIHEDSEVPQRTEVFINGPDPFEQRVVVDRRHAQELHATVTQGGYARDDVIGRDGDVLYARATVELEILVDLRLLLAGGRLVDGEFDAAVPIGHHLRHQRRIFGRDV